MPLLNFRPEFAALVESGVKRQTIRKRRKDGRDPQPFDRLYLYTGLRTKNARKLGEAWCRSVEPVRIRKIRGATSIRLKRRRKWVELELDEAQRLARADGLESLLAFRQWFERVHGLPFEGLLIRWWWC